MSPITTHVLDLTLGTPAARLEVRLERIEIGPAARLLAASRTNDDGRVLDLLPPGALESATYRLTFETGAYFAASGRETFYPQIQILFRVTAAHEHHHVPLLLSPFGYSTYRGS